MPRMIFVNLPVADLAASMAFYKALGFDNNPHFTDDTAACMVLSETINVMLLTQMASVHRSPHPTGHLERGHACRVLRQPRGGRCDE